jgi:hypothetical protein
VVKCESLALIPDLIANALRCANLFSGSFCPSHSGANLLSTRFPVVRSPTAEPGTFEGMHFLCSQCSKLMWRQQHTELTTSNQSVSQAKSEASSVACCMLWWVASSSETGPAASSLVVLPVQPWTAETESEARAQSSPCTGTGSSGGLRRRDLLLLHAFRIRCLAGEGAAARAACVLDCAEPLALSDRLLVSPTHVSRVYGVWRRVIRADRLMEPLSVV